MTQHEHTLFTHALPGHLLTHVPGTLGFFPQESAVFMGFENKDGSLFLGPIARVDLDHLDDCLDDVFDAVASHSDLVFAFVISEQPEDYVEAVGVELFDFASHDGRGIDACWHCPSIYTNSPYSIIFGPAEIDPQPTQDDWARGTIPDVLQAASMKPWIDLGELPEHSRDELYRRFDAPPGGPDLAARTQLSSKARAAARALCTAPVAKKKGRGSKKQESILGRCESAFAHIVAQALALVESGPGAAGELSAAAEELSHWLAITPTRDVLLGVIVQNAKPENIPALQQVILEVVHNYEGEVRSNALCAYALLALKSDFPVLGQAAMIEANQSLPSHRLSALMLQAYRAGLIEDIVNNVVFGSSQTADNWRWDSPRAPKSKKKAA